MSSKYKAFDDQESGQLERESLLSGHKPESQSENEVVPPTGQATMRPSNFVGTLFATAFAAGMVTCFVIQSFFGVIHYPRSCSTGALERPPPYGLAPPYVGSTERHHFPPTKPTNAHPHLFPSNVGYLGPIPTGAVSVPCYVDRWQSQLEYRKLLLSQRVHRGLDKHKWLSY